MNALKTREAGCKSEYELTVFFFISLDMYKPLFTLKNKLIMISITYGRDWSLLVMMNFYIRHNSMRRWNCMRVKNMISKNCISEKKYLFLTILRSFRFFENKWKTLFDMIIFLFMVWTLFPLYILQRYKQYGAYGYRELHTTEWYQSYTKEDYFCILYDPL